MTNHLKTALQRIRRSPYKTFAAVLIMTMTLFLASVFFLLAAGSSIILSYFETRPQVNAFFTQGYEPTPQEVDLISAKLEETGLVDSIKYVSRDAALKIYKDLNKSDPLLLEAVTANMLPASLEVSAKKPTDLTILADQLKSTPHIDDVRLAEDIVSTLTKWINSVRIIGISLVLVQIFITFVVILLIIGIKVGERRDEIYVLQLIGASRGFVSAPFVAEGIIYGVFGAVCAWTATFILLLYSIGFLVSFLAGIPVAGQLLPPPWWFILAMLGGEMFLGSLVGGLGGLIAVRRYLKA